MKQFLHLISCQGWARWTRFLKASVCLLGVYFASGWPKFQPDEIEMQRMKNGGILWILAVFFGNMEGGLRS